MWNTNAYISWIVTYGYIANFVTLGVFLFCFMQHVGPALDFIIHGPDVPCQRIGTALDGPGCQGKLIPEEMGIGIRVVSLQSIEVIRQSLQCVGAWAHQYVAEWTLPGRHVRWQEVPLHLQEEEER